MRVLGRIMVVVVLVSSLTASGSVVQGQQGGSATANPQSSDSSPSPSGDRVLVDQISDGQSTVQPHRLRSQHGWLHNSRERTNIAIDALQREESELAVAAASEARSLAPNNPVGLFNEGTTLLLTGDSNAAKHALEQVAENASETSFDERLEVEPDPGLSSDAAYNLGNAYFESQQMEQAVEWFEESLRQDPSRVAAKINLELALRAQQQQQEQQEQQEQQDQQQDQGQGEQQQQPRSGDQEQESDESQGQPQPQAGEQESPLPQFQPRPDMTAEEAASLLQAVEAMEREARAAEQPERRQAAPDNRDW